MAKQVVTRTSRARIQNHSQVCDDLDSLGFAASKLWNVGRWTAQRVWDACGQIPADSDLKSYLKGSGRYVDLHSQSSQRVLEELDEAFTGWYGHRNNGNQKANPPGYRKHNDQHPRSTITFKQKGFKHDEKNQRIRLSKGRNLKEGRSDFVLCEYDVIGPHGTTVKNVQQVRAVYEHGVWRLHIVCSVEIEVSEAPGNGVAGIDLGICNVAAVSFGDEALLYPGGAFKEDEYYFLKKRAECDKSTSREARRLDQRRTDRRHHFLHTLSKDIIQQCVEREVGTLVVGKLKGIRENEETGEPKNWGKHGNLDLHGWPFDKLWKMLEYKGEMEGIDVVRKSERDTSKTCAACGHVDDSQRKERGLYVCSECGTVANADCGGAENIRQKVEVPPSLPRPAGDRSNGWLAQPVVRLFDTMEGRFLPQEQAATNHNIPTAVGNPRPQRAGEAGK